MAYTLKRSELAGFDVIGYRQADGTIKLGSQNGTQLDDFPDEIELNGNVFALEEVKSQGHLPADHPGRVIEWGIYV